MSWANKALRKERLHRQVEQAMKDPRFQQAEAQKLKEATMSAFACFVLLSVDYLYRELGFKQKRIQRFLQYISKYMGYVTEDEEYFRLLHEELNGEIGFDVLETLGLSFRDQESR